MAVNVEEASFSIAYDEMKGSPKLTLSQEAGVTQAVRTVKCAGAIDTWVQLAKEFVGYSESRGGSYIYHNPHRLSFVSSLLIARQARYKPYGKLQGLDTQYGIAYYEFALLDIFYRMPSSSEQEEEDEEDTPYGTVRIEEHLVAASEFITLPTTGLKWGKDNSQTNPSEDLDPMDAPAKIVTMMEWQYIIRGATNIPDDVVIAPGYVNSNQPRSKSIGFTFPAGTLLCGNPQVDKVTDSEGVKTDLTLRFIYKNNGTVSEPKGWNYFPRSSKTGKDIAWERITDGTNDKDIYPTMSFGSLIV